MAAAGTAASTHHLGLVSSERPRSGRKGRISREPRRGGSGETAFRGALPPSLPLKGPRPAAARGGTPAPAEPPQRSVAGQQEPNGCWGSRGGPGTALPGPARGQGPRHGTTDAAAQRARFPGAGGAAGPAAVPSTGHPPLPSPVPAPLGTAGAVRPR